jgi:hypothetical protein
MNLGKFITDFANTPEGKKIFKKVIEKNKKVKKENKTKTSTVSKNKNERVGISASILNQSNLLKKKSTTKKKTLLGG